MVNHGTNHLGIDRSKTGGGRRRRQAADRKNQLRASNLYPIRVSRFGLVRDGSTWKLTALHAERIREKLVSDRRGGTTTETVETGEVRPTYPSKGLVVKTFDTKSEATDKYYTPDSWNRQAPGEYWGEGGTRSFKADRDEWHEWLRSV